MQDPNNRKTKLIDKTTKGRDIAVLFGDGAGAAIVQRSNDNSLIFLAMIYIYVLYF